MHFSCLTAGSLLARLGRPEVSNCIAGLKQYNYAYEEAGEEAIEMQRTYDAAVIGDSEINHMASVVLPQQHQQQSTVQPMAVDPVSYASHSSTHHNETSTVNHSPFSL